jgi:hypothetical protein
MSVTLCGSIAVRPELPMAALVPSCVESSQPVGTDRPQITVSADRDTNESERTAEVGSVERSIRLLSRERRGDGPVRTRPIGYSE